METRAGYMIVGTFVLLSMVGILSFFLWLAKTDLEYKTNFYTIYFQGSVTGLTLGGSVTYLGVPVGNVKKIELDSQNLECVKITIAIKDSIPIKEDAYASLELQGLTGYKFVQISGGSKESPLLKAKLGQPYPIISSRYSGVEEIMTTLPRMVNKFTNLVDRINATFNEENRKKFSNVLKNMDDLSKDLSESAAPLRGLIIDTRKTINTFDHNLQTLSFSAESILKRVDLVADHLSTLLKENHNALDTFTQTGSYELLQTLTETRDMVTSAKKLFEDLDGNPRKLLFDSQRKGVSVPQH